MINTCTYDVTDGVCTETMSRDDRDDCCRVVSLARLQARSTALGTEITAWTAEKARVDAAITAKGG